LRRPRFFGATTDDDFAWLRRASGAGTGRALRLDHGKALDGWNAIVAPSRNEPAMRHAGAGREEDHEEAHYPQAHALRSRPFAQLTRSDYRAVVGGSSHRVHL